MPMKSQAMAIITLHKLVAASVDDYRKRYPDWSTTVSSVLKKKKKKRKVNVETVSGASKKMKDNLSESGSEGEEHEKSDSENDGRCNVSNSDNEEESANSRSENEEENDSERDSGENSVSNEEENSETHEEEETDIEEKTENNLESEDDDNEILSEFEELIKNSKADIKKPIAKNTAVKSLKRHLEQPNPQPPMKKPTGTKAISQKKSNKVVKKNEEGKEGDKHPLKKPIKPKAAKEKPKVVDPFFMTTTNEEYLTSQAPTVSDEKDSNWKSKSDDYSQTRYNSFSNLNSRNQRSSREDNWNNKKRNKFSDREPHQHPKPFAQRSEKPFSNNGVEPFNIFTNRKERRKALQQPAQEEKVEKLHPSWEAKKKQTSIASFQGKKITFD